MYLFNLIANHEVTHLVVHFRDKYPRVVASPNLKLVVQNWQFNSNSGHTGIQLYSRRSDSVTKYRK